MSEVTLPPHEPQPSVIEGESAVEKPIAPEVQDVALEILVVESLRLEYYELAARILEEKRQVIDCYAGWASAHLAPDGNLWGCCVRAESMGNLREHGYDFRPVWFGETAEAFRRSVKNKECACPLANASYTNLLLDVPSLARVTANMAGLDRAKESE